MIKCFFEYLDKKLISTKDDRKQKTAMRNTLKHNSVEVRHYLQMFLQSKCKVKVLKSRKTCPLTLAKLLHCVRTAWALCAHCMHTVHTEAGILTQEYLPVT